MRFEILTFVLMKAEGLWILCHIV